MPPGCEAAARHRIDTRNPLPAEQLLEERLLETVRGTLRSGGPIRVSLPIGNADRAVGARLAYEIARAHGDTGLPPGSIRVTFTGVAGQSFGAFLPRGVTFHLTGQANDGVGKGLAGGEIVLRPDPRLRGASHEHALLGNAVLYGVTAGSFLAAGRAGERFAIRNSGATAVIEGVGNHGCEYMTGGTVVVLGPTGYNFAAGMTGGEAFVLELDLRRFNGHLVHLTPMLESDGERLHALVAEYAAQTGSTRAKALLRNWPAALARFSRVAPKTEVREISSDEEGAMTAD